ncbi:glutathione S-transferase family protein [Rhodomicrobium lacus]|uniref:glutathione S-transferase family protein n=1 Tax=Rhodomicrobium TaxID=1068 RepID=UPI0026E28BF2|nr:glutathione S-transferase family protein [Rhodomicrobium lacus]WKW50817.1 glutathione S-transferase family protein [Rhodomicrobium lacus]
MIEIYGRPTAWNVRKVLFFTEDAGIPYRCIDYGREFRPTNTPEFLDLNPNGLVPVLRDGSFTLWESHAVLRYLAAKYGPPGYYPVDFQGRAIVDQWLDWKLGHVSPALRVLFMRYFLRIGEFTDREAADREAEANRLFTVLDGRLEKTSAYVAGPEITIADSALGMAVHRWLNLPLRRPDLPHVIRYYERLQKLPSFEKTVCIGIP